MIEIPGTDTPGIYTFDLRELAWAAKFACPPENTDARRATNLELIAAPADAPAGASVYPELCGCARVNTGALLDIINRLAFQARDDRDTITRLRAELANVGADLDAIAEAATR